MEPASKRPRLSGLLSDEPAAQAQPATTGLASVLQVSDVDDFHDACFSDVLAAMTLLTDQHKLHKRNLPDMVLKSQLYTILKDRTASDRELDELRRKGQVRTFKLPTGADEYGLMTAAQYTSLITSMTASQPQSQAPAAAEPLKESKAKTGPAVGSTPDTKSIAAKQSLDRFMQHVLPHWHDITIPKYKLEQLLLQQAGCAGHIEQDISQLLSHSLLSRDPRVEDSYVFTLPNMGKLVKQVVAGRKELLSLLSKRKYGEVMEKELITKRKLMQSSLGMQFHLRDVQGLGLASKTDTPAGPVIRLVKKAG